MLQSKLYKKILYTLVQICRAVQSIHRGLDEAEDIEGSGDGVEAGITSE